MNLCAQERRRERDNVFCIECGWSGSGEEEEEEESEVDAGEALAGVNDTSFGALQNNWWLRVAVDSSSRVFCRRERERGRCEAYRKTERSSMTMKKGEE